MPSPGEQIPLSCSSKAGDPPISFRPNEVWCSFHIAESPSSSRMRVSFEKQKIPPALPQQIDSTSREGLRARFFLVVNVLFKTFDPTSMNSMLIGRLAASA